MKYACGSSLFTSIASVAGLVLVGVSGYNMVTTGCILGKCEAGAVVTSVSTESSHSCGSGCSDHANEDSNVIEASQKTDASKADGCCNGEGLKEDCCGGTSCSPEGKDASSCDESKECAPAATPKTIANN